MNINNKKVLKNITHIFFDVDGTLYDKNKEYIAGKGSVDDAHKFFRYQTYELALKNHENMQFVAEESVRQYKMAMEQGVLQQTISYFPEELKKRYNDLVNKHESNGKLFMNEFGTSIDYFARIVEHVDFDSILLPDPFLQETIQYLKREGYSLGILTNEVYATIVKISRAMAFSIRDFSLNTGTEYPIFCKETGTSKPDISSFVHALKMNNILPQKAAYVGDSYSKDIVPALSAGMTAIHIKHSEPGILQVKEYTQIGAIQDLRQIF
jgi:HAD superfamily hydrolase (TIGR01549 family)